MSSKASRRSTVLVADDSSDTREMYADYLRFAGFNVDTAVDGVTRSTRPSSTHPTRSCSTS
jgi:DNA-binding response OmpR family regulator